ncbi:hypothetical protein B0A48_02255 [Cryoendolithus antarcticus]|uniref:Ketoreductase domain-containing protein n=1 Tax=Cryoendolithus antarcticus TaxID=1507870 RepID=A0A1V8TNF7_9PEZI|nr:hypothetical protein B0A48_02255 [Cryoendolithus antarcticus]
MRNILVTGGASGLGRAFVDAYSAQPDTTVISLDRTFQHDLRKNIRTFVVDVTSEAAVTEFASFLINVGPTPIDLVIHSAGVRGLVPALEKAHPENVAACETLQAMDLETMQRAFSINTLGTFTLLRALVPLLLLSPDPKVIVMSSRMGSIGNNQLGNKDAGGAYAYRASKAALNMIIRSFAVDVPRIAWVMCHPGRVETGLVDTIEEGAISAEESVGGLLPLIEGWDRSNTGLFYDRFGERIEW